VNRTALARIVEERNCRYELLEEVGHEMGLFESCELAVDAVVAGSQHMYPDSQEPALEEVAKRKKNSAEAVAVAAVTAVAAGNLHRYPDSQELVLQDDEQVRFVFAGPHGEIPANRKGQLHEETMMGIEANLRASQVRLLLEAVQTG
jgi:hypothetical protein